MSNLFWCKKCLNMSTRPRITFDKNIICNACTWAEEKKTIDWKKREKELEKLVNKHKGNSEFDCIIPVSGGKDGTYVTDQLKNKYSLKPLCITVKPALELEIGKTNLTLNIEKPFSLDKVYWLSSPNGNKRLVIDLYFSSETDFIVTKKSFESFSKEEFESVLGEKPIREDKELELFIGQNKNNSKMSQQKNIISEDNNLNFDKEGTKSFLVVIDPGHGGKDPGAIGFSKTLEKDVNLIASKH